MFLRVPVRTRKLGDLGELDCPLSKHLRCGVINVREAEGKFLILFFRAGVLKGVRWCSLLFRAYRAPFVVSTRHVLLSKGLVLRSASWRALVVLRSAAS